MKIYWKVSNGLDRFFDDTDYYDPSFFFLPNSCMDSIITRADNSVSLLHSDLGETLQMSDAVGRTQELRTYYNSSANPSRGQSREALVLS